MLEHHILSPSRWGYFSKVSVYTVTETLSFTVLKNLSTSGTFSLCPVVFGIIHVISIGFLELPVIQIVVRLESSSIAIAENILNHRIVSCDMSSEVYIEEIVCTLSISSWS